MTSETHRERPLRLALVGMSGTGKTFWTKRLAASGHPAICCDDRIEERLAPKLAAGGYGGINGGARGMGLADSATYARSQGEYLAGEDLQLDEILNKHEKKTGKT